MTIKQINKINVNIIAISLGDIFFLEVSEDLAYKLFFSVFSILLKSFFGDISLLGTSKGLEFSFFSLFFISKFSKYILIFSMLSKALKNLSLSSFCFISRFSKYWIVQAGQGWFPSFLHYS